MKLLTLLSCVILAQSVFSQQEILSSSIEKKELSGHSQMMEVLISPNPAIDKCIIHGEQGSTCTLYSSLGTYIGKWIIEDSNTILLTDLPSGILQVIIEKNGTTIVKRIVVI